MHRLDGALDVSGGNNGANGGFQVAQRQRIHLPMQETQERDAGWIPGLGRSPGGKMANHSRSLKNPMDRGAWRATVYGVAKSWT